MIVIESTGRKPKDAIDSGLKKLNKSLAEVEVEILDHGGLFRKAKVRITAQGDEPVEKAQEELRIEKSEIREERKAVGEPKKEPKKEPRREPKKEVRENREKEPKKQPEARLEANKDVIKEEHKEEHKEDHKERQFNPITDEARARAEEFIKGLVAKMGVEAEYTTEVVDGELHINFKSQTSTLIGYHGEVLDSIEYLVSFIVNKDPDKYYHISVNCNDYREKRKEILVALANKMAAKCLKVRHKIVLEPMSNNERKIIHSALSGNDQIITKSEGQEPNRRVVILCKKR